jgi:hypothetical protein
MSKKAIEPALQMIALLPRVASKFGERMPIAAGYIDGIDPRMDCADIRRVIH